MIAAILAATVGLFIWGRWRHDIVASAALLSCVFLGLVPSEDAFSGFAHPAVITVACVLVLSHGLQITGAVNALARKFLPSSGGPALSILAISALGSVLSGFMNNVGALALLMPAAIRASEDHGLPPGKMLMPLSFACILGGTATLIGTPPNLIISGFRAQAGRGAFSMFDFAPVGAAITIIGVLFIGFIGWRLVPRKKRSGADGFETGAYLSEVSVREDSPFKNKTVRELEILLEGADAQVLGMVRGDFHVVAPHPGYVLRNGDILVIEAEPESLSALLSEAGLKLEEEVDSEDGSDGEKNHPGRDHLLESYRGYYGGRPSEDEEDGHDSERQDEIVIRELVCMPGSSLSGLSATDMRLRTRYGINLLAVSRKGKKSISRLRTTPLYPGDVLLIQGTPEAISTFASDYGCLPLASRDIMVPKKGQALAASIIMGCAVGSAAFGVFPAPVSFAAGALVMILFKIVPLRSVYTAVDWPVVVLLGSMLPVAGAMSLTGTADLIARFLMESVAGGNAVIALVVIIAGTMIFTDFMNNAATAAVMAPIAMSAAAGLGADPDSFLMAVAIGASCAFLTPIGHQNNTLILGPGGFSFGDYWRLGLPMDLLVIIVAVPLLLWVWPL